MPNGRKGIVKDLDKGFYDEARARNVSSLEYLTELVKPEPEEVDRLKPRVLATLGLKSEPVGGLGQAVDRYAWMYAGLAKELEARDIRGDDTVEQAFFSSANGPSQPLFPVFLASKIIAGQLAASLVPYLTAADLRIDSHVQEKVTISDTTATRRLGAVGEGVDLPKTTISRTNGSITLNKYGRMLEATYESIRLLHLDIISLQLERMGRQIGIDETDDLIEVGIAGDGNSSTAVTDTDAEVTGTLDYDELVRLALAFPIGYSFRQAVVNDTNMRTILNMAEFKDPMVGTAVFQRTGQWPNPMGAMWHRWTSTGSTSFSTDRILAVDDRAAMIVYREGDFLEESDRLIDKQIQRATMSEWVGYMKWDTNATQCLDIS